MREEYVVEGRTLPQPADNTKKSLNCEELGYDPKKFLKTAAAADFKVFWRWVMNTYNRIMAGNSLQNYCRVLRMHMVNAHSRTFNEVEARDLRNVSDACSC